MTEIECGELQELYHLDQFTPDEEGAAPEHDPSKSEKIEAGIVSGLEFFVPVMDPGIPEWGVLTG